MNERCGVCGFDIDLCVCDSLPGGIQNKSIVKVSLINEDRETILEGIPIAKAPGLKKLLQKDFVCSATVTNKRSGNATITLRGNHKQKIHELLSAFDLRE